MDWLIFFINLSIILAVLILALLIFLLSYKQKVNLENQKIIDSLDKIEILEGLLNHSDTIFYMHDISGKIKYVNQIVDTVLGLNSKLLLGKSFQSLMSAENNLEWENYLQKIFQDKKSHGNYYLLNKQGEPILFQYRCQGIVEDGSVVAIKGHAQIAESIHPSSSSRVKSVSMNSPNTSKKAGRPNGIQMSIAHDLKNIFSAILGFSDIIKEDDAAKEDILSCNLEITAAGKRGIEAVSHLITDFYPDSFSPGGGSSIETERETNAEKPQILHHGKGHILYVDDEQSLLKMYSKFLEKLGYSVEGYTQGRDAINAFKGNKQAYDLVITDWLMPKMSGKELVKKIKDIRSDIPIVVLTGKTLMDVQKTGLSAIIEKPVDPVKMSAIILQALFPSGKINNS